MTAAPRPSRRLSFCKRGHSMDDENVYLFKDGHRTCKQCKKDRQNKMRRRIKAEGERQRAAGPMSPYLDGDPWLSPDLHTIYFWRSTTVDGWHLWTASR